MKEAQWRSCINRRALLHIAPSTPQKACTNGYIKPDMDNQPRNTSYYTRHLKLYLKPIGAIIKNGGVRQAQARRSIDNMRVLVMNMLLEQTHAIQ